MVERRIVIGRAAIDPNATTFTHRWWHRLVPKRWRPRPPGWFVRTMYASLTDIERQFKVDQNIAIWPSHDHNTREQGGTDVEG